MTIGKFEKISDAHRGRYQKTQIVVRDTLVGRAAVSMKRTDIYAILVGSWMNIDLLHPIRFSARLGWNNFCP
jgi:hypothetical protein